MPAKFKKPEPTHYPELLRQPETDVERAIVESGGLMLTDADAVSADIAARILSADSAEAVLAPQTTTPADDLIDVPLRIEGVKWLGSTFQEGPAVYAVVSAVDLRPGQAGAVTVTTGAQTALAQLFRLAQLDAFPVLVRFVRAPKATAAGYYPVWLEMAKDGDDF